MYETIKIYTDGACSGNPGKGGWASIIVYSQTEITLKGYEKNTTNNRMELKALIEALNYIHNNFQLNINKINIEIYSDSKYLVDGINKWLKNWVKNEWKNSTKKTIKNSDLWEIIHIRLKELKYKIIWVKGHKDNYYNNLADKIATTQIKNN